MNAASSDRRRGQALAEFAVVVPVLLVMMVALFDAGRAVINYTELSNASRVGARVAMVNQSHDASCVSADPTYKCAAADHTATMGIAAASIDDAEFADLDGNSVVPDAEVCRAYGFCSVVVTVSHTFTPITPFVTAILGPINLTASTTMQIERTYANP